MNGRGMGVSGKWSEERDDVMLRCDLMVVKQTLRFEMILGERLWGESSAGIEICLAKWNESGMLRWQRGRAWIGRLNWEE